MPLQRTPSCHPRSEERFRGTDPLVYTRPHPAGTTGTPVALLPFDNRGRADKPGDFYSPRPTRRTTMADTIRGKLTEAGNTVAEGAKKLGNRVGEKAEEAKDWVK